MKKEFEYLSELPHTPTFKNPLAAKLYKKAREKANEIVKLTVEEYEQEGTAQKIQQLTKERDDCLRYLHYTIDLDNWYGWFDGKTEDDKK